MISKKKIAALMLAGTMSLTMLASGCGKKEVLYNIEDNSEHNSVDNDNIAEGRLAGELGIPESCAVNIDVGATGLESISLKDDEIRIPKTDSMSVAYCEMIQMDNAKKQKLVESFFEKDKGIYEYNYGFRIKSEIEEEIEEIERLEQEITDTDPWLDSLIADLKRELQDAPEEYPAAGDYSGETFIGTMNGIDYRLYFREGSESNMNSGSLYIADEFSYKMHEGGLLITADHFSYRPHEDATGGFFTMGPQVDNFTKVNTCSMTLEEAIRLAEDFLYNAGITNMMQTDAYVVQWNYYDESTGDDVAVEYDGYVLSFRRMINNTPVYKESVWDVDNLQTGDFWIDIPTENFDIYVDDNGVMMAEWRELFSLTGKEEENVDLLAWDEMLEAANKNIPAYYEKYPTNYNKIEFNDIQLSYYPVQDESKENGYKYIPVWIFSQYENREVMIGSVDMGYVYPDTSMEPVQLVIVNAMDGTVIDIVEQSESLGIWIY